MLPDPIPTARQLVPLDGSGVAEQALPYVRTLATPTTEIMLVQVVPEPQPRFDQAGCMLAPVDTVLTDEVTRATAILDQIAASWGLPPQRVQVEVAVGDPATALLEVATARSSTMLIIASHGRGALGRWRFGSVADRLARSASIPVLIVRAQDAAPASQHPAQITRLLVPLDGSPLAEHALPVAGALAQQLSCPIHLLRVVSPAEPAVIPATAPGAGVGPGPVPAPSLARGTAGVDAPEIAAARAYLERITQSPALARVTVIPDVLTGKADHELLAVAGSTDLFVLTSHGRGGVARWLLGSVAEKLIRLATAPVLLVPARATPASE